MGFQIDKNTLEKAITKYQLIFRLVEALKFNVNCNCQSKLESMILDSVIIIVEQCS